MDHISYMCCIFSFFIGALLGAETCACGVRLEINLANDWDFM